MKIFPDYKHGSDSQLFEKIKEYLWKNAEGDLKTRGANRYVGSQSRKDCGGMITKDVFESALLQVQPKNVAKLRIYPMSIKPYV